MSAPQNNQFKTNSKIVIYCNVMVWRNKMNEHEMIHVYGRIKHLHMHIVCERNARSLK